MGKTNLAYTEPESLRKDAGNRRCQSQNLSNTTESTADIKEIRHAKLMLQVGFFFEVHEFGHNTYRQYCKHCSQNIFANGDFFSTHIYLLFLFLLVCGRKLTGFLAELTPIIRLSCTIQ
jgi:hypothetical protein